MTHTSYEQWVTALGEPFKKVYEKIQPGYSRLFSLDEIDREPILVWAYGAVIFFFFETFSMWSTLSSVTVETARAGGAVCWPYFKECASLYFLHNLPFGYSQTELYMALYGVMLAVIYCMWKRQWAAAHFLTCVLFAWKIFVGFVLNYFIFGPYDYYHILFCLVILFAPYKEYFLRLSFVLLYFICSTIKIYPTWILGSYFSALKTGVPVFPDFTIPYLTNLVIVMQIVGCWFLLSKHKILQRLAFIYFLIFHLYSGILVYYHYPSIALPLLIILFGPWFRVLPVPWNRRAIAGWSIMILVCLFQLPGYIIPGDQKISLEGNRYGMFMFEANHQCVATVTTFGVDMPKRKQLGCSGLFCLVDEQPVATSSEHGYSERYESASSWNRCDPYEWWTRLHNRCAANPQISRIALQFDHSLNGGLFYRIVDTPNICALDYLPFGHNEWIKLPPEAPAVGKALQNIYRY